MDDIKLYAKNEQDIYSLIHFTRVFNSNIGMTFGLSKCGRLIANRCKMKCTSRISLLKGQIDDIDRRYKCITVFQLFGNNDKDVGCKATSEYRNRVRQVLRKMLSSKKMVTAINTIAVPVIRYPAVVVSWGKEDLKETDIGKRKLMMMHGVFHPKSSTAERKEEGFCTASKMLCAKKNRA